MTVVWLRAASGVGIKIDCVVKDSPLAYNRASEYLIKATEFSG